MGGLALAAGGARGGSPRRPCSSMAMLELAIAVSALAVPRIALVETVYVALLGGESELPEGGARMRCCSSRGVRRAVARRVHGRHAAAARAPRGAPRRTGRVARRGALRREHRGAIAGTLCRVWLIPDLGYAYRCGRRGINGAVFALAGARARRGGTEPNPRRSGVRGWGWICRDAASGAVCSLRGALDAPARTGARIEPVMHSRRAASFLLGIALGGAARLGLRPRANARAWLRARPARTALTPTVSMRPPTLPRSRSRSAGGRAPLGRALAAAALLPIRLCIARRFRSRALARVAPRGRTRATAACTLEHVGAIAGRSPG